MEIWFYGLADDNGVESFVEDLDIMATEVFFTDEEKKKKNSEQFAMCLRAQANHERHAVVYRVLLDEKDSAEVESLIAGGSFSTALAVIKSKAKEVQLGTYGTTKEAAIQNWHKIPNI